MILGGTPLLAAIVSVTAVVTRSVAVAAVDVRGIAITAVAILDALLRMARLGGVLALALGLTTGLILDSECNAALAGLPRCPWT